MTESKEILTMRAQAWARAKGELEAVLNSYWSEDDAGRKEFKKVDKLFETFINDYQDNHL